MKIALAIPVVFAALAAAPAASAAPPHPVAHGQCEAQVSRALGVTGIPVLAWRRDQLVRDYAVPGRGVVRVAYAHSGGCWRMVGKRWFQ